MIEETGVLRGVDEHTLRGTVVGLAFAKPLRHGKWLAVPMRQVGRVHRKSDPTVVFHFGMTGELVWCPLRRGEVEPRHRDDRIIFRTEHGELRYRDLRKLHGVRLVPDDTSLERLLGHLGPDALNVSAAEFRERLAGLCRQIKPALMDQDVVAGLGNLLVDEILWRSRIHPRRQTTDLSDHDLARLYRHMRKVLHDSIPTGRVPGYDGWLTGVRDEEGAPCPRCGTPLRRSRTGGRATVWCATCQPSPSALPE